VHGQSNSLSAGFDEVETIADVDLAIAQATCRQFDHRVPRRIHGDAPGSSTNTASMSNRMNIV